MRGAIPPLPTTLAWRGAQLKHRDNLTITFYLYIIKESVHLISPPCFGKWQQLQSLLISAVFECLMKTRSSGKKVYCLPAFLLIRPAGTISNNYTI
jgi:hypothetical protein